MMYKEIYTQVQFIIKYSNIAICHVKKLKSKSNMTLLIDAEKAFD